MLLILQPDKQKDMLMETFLKKSITLVFAIASVVTMFAADFDEDGISYDIISEEQKTVEVVNNNSSYVGDVVIPSRVTHEGVVYKVAAIHFQAFFKCADLYSVSIPETVTDMGQYSFTQCTSLQTVQLPSNAVSIPNGMFWGCTSLKTVEIPSGVTEIGDYAFANCTSLESVNLPDGIEYMGKAALMGTALKEFILPPRLVDMSPFLLALTTKLENVRLHDKVETLGECVFQGNTALHAVTLPKSLKSIDASAFAQCPGLQEIVIPDGITSLPANCFFNDMALRKVVLGRGVSTIGADCFARYKNNSSAPQLRDVYLLSDAIVSGGENFIDEAYQNAVLHVKSELVEAYKSQPGWMRFASIVAISDGELSGITAVGKAGSDKTLLRYGIGGTLWQGRGRGICVVKGRKTVVTDTRN